jgi:hypothetical protein
MNYKDINPKASLFEIYMICVKAILKQEVCNRYDLKELFDGFVVIIFSISFMLARLLILISLPISAGIFTFFVKKLQKRYPLPP